MSACVRERERVRGTHENIILWQKLIFMLYQRSLDTGSGSSSKPGSGSSPGRG